VLRISLSAILIAMAFSRHFISSSDPTTDRFTFAAALLLLGFAALLILWHKDALMKNGAACLLGAMIGWFPILLGGIPSGLTGAELLQMRITASVVGASGILLLAIRHRRLVRVTP